MVFEGGGVLGIAHVGALKRLYELDVLKNIKRVAGSSVGGIIASMIAMKCSYQDIENYLYHLDFSKLKSNSNGCFRNIFRILFNYGYYKGDMILDWIGKIIEEQIGNKNATFQEIYDKTNILLILTGTSLNSQKTIYYSYLTQPNMKLMDAIHITTSVPLLYESVKMNNDVLIDGGVLDNFPIHLFDKDEYGGENKVNSKTIGLKLLTLDEINNYLPPVTNIKSYIAILINTIYQQSLRIHIHEEDWKRTIKINIGTINSFNFNIKNEDKRFLLEQGYDAINTYYQI